MYNFFVINYIIKKEGFSERLNPVLASWLKYRAVTTVVIWTLSILVSLISPGIAKLLFLLIFVFQFFVDRHFRKKQKSAVINVG